MHICIYVYTYVYEYIYIHVCVVFVYRVLSLFLKTYEKGNSNGGVLD